MADALFHALAMAFAMGWDILWALILGFSLSGVIQAVVTKGEMGRLLPDASPRSILIASGLGAASSSCSYAAVALARSIFRKGGDFIAAMAFQFASTNLVLELGIIMAVLMGWQFTAAEFVGGPIMIVMLVIILRSVMNRRLIEEARRQADRGLQGRMEGHAGMDMSVGGEGSILARALSAEGFTAISHYFIMDWASIWIDVVLGLLIAGALGAWVPNDVWQQFFLAHDPTWSKVVGPLIGPVVAIVSFVCSVGNVPLAAVLWNGGISFGGVVAFIFADLIVLPVLDIYRKYYGLKIAGLLFAVFFVAMAGAGYVVEMLFDVLGWSPRQRTALVVESHVSWNYTTVLNIVFLALAGLMTWRFLKTGGPAMLRMMNQPMDGQGHDDHAHAQHTHAGHSHAHHRRDDD
ncbi:MAG TPA: permease [Alphaproteobacteria bacterium]|nr:permease [Alphaproteobacteria bacterium]